MQTSKHQKKKKKPKKLESKSAWAASETVMLGESRRPQYNGIILQKLHCHFMDHHKNELSSLPFSVNWDIMNYTGEQHVKCFKRTFKY